MQPHGLPPTQRGWLIPVLLFSKLNKMFGYKKYVSKIIKINCLRGDLTDISAKKEALIDTQSPWWIVPLSHAAWTRCSCKEAWVFETYETAALFGIAIYPNVLLLQSCKQDLCGALHWPFFTRRSVKLFSKLNLYLFGYFDPINIYFDNKNECFSG